VPVRVVDDVAILPELHVRVVDRPGGLEAAGQLAHSTDPATVPQVRRDLAKPNNICLRDRSPFVVEQVFSVLPGIKEEAPRSNKGREVTRDVKAAALG
jgi:hypothetical protein